MSLSPLSPDEIYDESADDFIPNQELAEQEQTSKELLEHLTITNNPLTSQLMARIEHLTSSLFEADKAKIYSKMNTQSFCERQMKKLQNGKLLSYYIEDNSIKFEDTPHALRTAALTTAQVTEYKEKITEIFKHFQSSLLALNVDMYARCALQHKSEIDDLTSPTKRLNDITDIVTEFVDLQNLQSTTIVNVDFTYLTFAYTNMLKQFMLQQQQQPQPQPLSHAKHLTTTEDTATTWPTRVALTLPSNIHNTTSAASHIREINDSQTSHNLAHSLSHKPSHNLAHSLSHQPSHNLAHSLSHQPALQQGGTKRDRSYPKHQFHDQDPDRPNARYQPNSAMKRHNNNNFSSPTSYSTMNQPRDNATSTPSTNTNFSTVTFGNSKNIRS